MGSSPSLKNDRDRLEQELRKEMRAAEKAYGTVLVEHAKVRAEFGNMLDHPECRHAVEKESLAFENYARALDALHGFDTRKRLVNSVLICPEVWYSRDSNLGGGSEWLPLMRH